MPLYILNSALSPNIVGNITVIKLITKPISTTNITGFLAMYFGLNFLKAPIIELFNISLVINLDLFLFDIYTHDSFYIKSTNN